MTFLVTMLPLLIVVVIFVGIVLIVRKTSKLKIHSASRGMRLLQCYIAILVIGVITYYVIPQKNIAYLKEPIMPELNDVDYHIRQVESKEDLEQIEGLQIKNQFSVAFEGDYLTVEPENADYAGVPIYVVRKDVNDDNIDITHYQSAIVAGDLEIGSRGMELDGSSLNIIYPDFTRLDLAMFGELFTSNQFTERKLMDVELSRLIGTEVYYLEIPKDLKLDGNISILQQ